MSQLLNRGIGPEGYFEQYYLSREWRFYKGILSRIVEASEPGCKHLRGLI